MQDNGASMLTVHFLNTTHLLVTYSSRGLVERIPGDPPDDQDRAVVALLVELPAGKVLARTRWHLHDYSQYLWSLGNGRFLLRIQSTLTAIAPLENLASGDAFRQTPFARPGGRLIAIIVAPEHDLVTVEAIPDRKSKNGEVILGDVPAQNDQPLANFYFVRISGKGSPESPLVGTVAGIVRGQGAGGLPLNGRGYLYTKSGKRNSWTMLFEGFDGQGKTLSNIDSSCPPQMQFVSPSQFVVFSCRGSNDNLMLSAFDFAPHEMWEEPMSGSVPFDQFLYAQQAGRFALSRTSANSTDNLAAMSPGQGASNTQEVRVYQVESGDLLLKLTCTPSSSRGQNFDMSEDGLSFLAVRSGVIEIYPLPPLSGQDKKDLAEVKEFEPPPNSKPVQLRRIVEVAAAEAGQEAENHEAVSTSVAESTVVAAPKAGSASSTVEVGDAQGRRKPPTLLYPGETVEGGKKKTSNPNQ